MTAHDLSVSCPVCGGALTVLRAQCDHCAVIVEGRFAPLEFNRLSPGHLELLRLFVRTRGNLKEMGRLVGVSYPTIRARFEELLRALGYEALPSAESLEGERHSILDALEAGELTPAEAAERLRRVGQGGA